MGRGVDDATRERGVTVKHARRAPRVARRRVAAIGLVAVTAVWAAAGAAGCGGSGGSASGGPGSAAVAGSPRASSPVAAAGGASAAATGGASAAAKGGAAAAAKGGALSAPEGTPGLVPGPIPGLLLIADRGNNRLLLVDSHKRIIWRYPRPGRRPTYPFVFDDDAFFGPGFHDIISNQEFQETIQVISFPAGRVVWHYGHPGLAGSSPGYLQTPDDAYLLPGGVRSVADVANQRILFISAAGKIVRQLGTTGVGGHDPPRLLGSPNGATPLPGGGTLITEISGSWIDAVSATGRLLWSAHVPAGYPSDAQPMPGGRVLLADYASPGRILIVNHRGRVLWSYGPASGPGMLDHPSLALPLPNGLIAVNDDYRHRVVIIDPRRKAIVWQYGRTDRPGRAAGLLNTPDGMDLLPASAIAGDPALQALLTVVAPGR
jgi:hypothetical protein